MASFDFQSKFARNDTGEILRSLSKPDLDDWEINKDIAH
jgi:hypothetical protein